jgi:hypothetical protein
MPVTVEDRHIYIRTGQKSQTVNVCNPSNQRGDYDYIIRLFPPDFVTDSEVGARTTIVDLIDWLKRAKNGEVEKPLPDDGDADAPAVIGADAPEDDWLRQAVSMVEESLDGLLREFLSDPYAHRVEHSLHARLFTILTAHPHLQTRIPLIGGRFFSQPVHKEWPETIPRPETKRGNFDLAVLPPSVLGNAGTGNFRKGRVVAPIVIEIGLDYGAAHLADDQDKLLHSKVRHGYLLHLTRVGKDNARVNQIIQDPGGEGTIKTAFARVTGSQKFVKFVGDTSIREWKASGQG